MREATMREATMREATTLREAQYGTTPDCAGYKASCTTKKSAVDCWDAKITHQDIGDEYEGQSRVIGPFRWRSLSFHAITTM
ncbi:hypothetical protein NUU61_001460 [Penicillium alfredii]|uniref:Uncharacterized protein n=1 Tax=Penicillium alfredii TaxID=1506179 RepID=A0A9W9G545_9EURO|nr:uncharacterized protein NUU61_001460 [Penicillium alfredii]KAJ5111830.1 hypothetical protein NUU61_001460 [Penicillium alfredii]